MNKRVAIIGCGRMGGERARAAMQAGASVCGVVDTDEMRASALAATCGARAYSNAGDLPWTQLDAVFVCTPPFYRNEPIAHAVRSGVDVLVEKPFALDAGSAVELAALVEGTKITAAVGYMNRYRAGVLLARELGQTDDFIGLTVTWAGKPYGVPWWGQVEQSGGPINEQATHLIDLLRYVRGEIGEVYSIANTAETHLAVALEFERGGIATLLYSCEAQEKHISVQMLTRRGRLLLSGWDFVAHTNAIDGRLPVDETSVFQIETQAFLNGAIRSDFSDAARTQVAVDRVRRAVVLS